MSGWRGLNFVTYIIFQSTSYSIKAQMLEILKLLLSQAIWKLFMQYLYRMCLTGKGLFQDGGPKCPPGLNFPQEFQKKPGFSYNLKNAEILLYYVKQMFFCLFVRFTVGNSGNRIEFLNIYVLGVSVYIYIYSIYNTIHYISPKTGYCN